MAHIVRPSTWATRTVRVDGVEMLLAALLEQHLPDATAQPERSILADELTGEAATPTRFRVWVPSHSKAGTAYRVRVMFHRPRPGAPHGYVTAVHELHGCEAHEARIRCWHLDCGLAAVIRDFRHLLPNGGKISEPAHHVHAVPDPEPEHRVPPPSAAGFYD